MIDRTLRPLFDHRMRNETQVVATVLSIDEKNDPDVLAIVASSLALAASDIPWNGPIGAVRVGYVEGNFVINPTTEQKQKSEMEIIVCGKDGKINMIEGKVKQVPEEIVVKGLEAAVPAIEKLVEWQEKIIKDIGKEKYKPEFQEAPEAMIEMFQKHTKERVRDAIFEIPEKNDRNSILGNLKGEWMETCIKEFPETL
jgi:polyribonucleotide nucleotidyltransferase